MKYKFVKPFSSFLDPEYFNRSLKENWIFALHDPMYLLLWVIGIIILISLLS